MRYRVPALVVLLALATGGGALVTGLQSSTSPCGAGAVAMTRGQADIDSHGTGTHFCLTGTHNWTLTPKSGDYIQGDGTAVLDGQNSTQFAVVAADGVSKVILAGLEIRNYQAGDAQGAIHAPDPAQSTGWILGALNVHDIGNGTNNGAGVEFGSGWTVYGGRYWNARQEGLTAGGGASNITVEFARIDHNDFTNDTYTSRNHSCGDEAGGFKWVADNVTVKNSTSDDNACKGLWADIGSDHGLVSHNTISNNWDEGVFWEISGSLSVQNNIITGNGNRNYNGNCAGFGWGGGITISTSGQTNRTGNGTIDIGHNTLTNNCNGIGETDQQRPEGDCPCELANVAVHDNTISGGSSGQTGAWQDDGDNLTTHNLTWRNNTYKNGASQCGTGC